MPGFFISKPFTECTVGKFQVVTETNLSGFFHISQLAVEQMALDDLFEHLRRAGVIPNSIRINDRDRPMRADAQAVDLAAINQRLWAHQIELVQPLLEELPRGECLLAWGAVRFGLIGAQENVPAVLFQAQGGS